jgi:predicted TIM-barrel fold metal-dependent hydrolase
MKKIDMHCHTTNRKVENLIPESASVDAILRKMREHNIERTVLLASYFPHKGSGISNFRLLDWTSDREEFCIFGSLDFKNYFHQGMNELQELAESRRLYGIKIYTCYQEIDLDSMQMKQVTELAKRFSLPLMFHTGYSYSSIRKFNRPSFSSMVKASDLEAIALANPELHVIASHMSKPFFEDAIRAVKRNPNICTDVSGLIDSKHDRNQIPGIIENIKRFLQECGPNQIMFGTDFPVQTHEDSVYFIEEAMKEFNELDKMKVYYHNAQRVLKNARPKS